MQPEPSYVPTSIATNIVGRMQRTHKRRGMSVFSGPPGIGKTTAIEAFADSHPGCVAVIKINNTRASDRIVLQHAVEAVRELKGSPAGYVYHDSFQVRGQLAGELDDWARRRWGDRIGNPPVDYDELPPFTFVFDEAQNLSRAAIEALRYWNDRDRCYSPFPVGLIFVGNAEFSLQAGKSGESVISAAVADRALYVESFDYGDVSNKDLSLFLSARGIEDAAAIAAIVKHFSSPRTPRSFRQITRILADLIEEAAGASITIETVQAVL